MMTKIPSTMSEETMMDSFAACPWKHAVRPFQILGNVYYIGDDFAGPLLIDTGDGLVIIDTGMPTMAPFLVHNIYELGFNPKNIKKIIHTHFHFDHTGATMVLKQISGAELYLSAEDTQVYIERPELAHLGNLNMGWPLPFVDHEIRDEERIRQGNLELQCYLTPGHTDGSMSFIFDIWDGEKKYRAALFGGAGLITLHKEYLMENFGSMENREKYRHSLDILDTFEGIEVTLSNHPEMNAAFEKQKYKEEHPNQPNPFINPDEWKLFVQEMRTKFEEMIALPEEQ